MIDQENKTEGNEGEPKPEVQAAPKEPQKEDN
jgi:hypothetical protein